MKFFESREMAPIRVTRIVAHEYLRVLSSKELRLLYRVILPWVFFDAVTAKLQTLLFLVTEFMWDKPELFFSEVKKRKASKYPEIFGGDECAKSQVATNIPLLGRGSRGSVSLGWVEVSDGA